MSSFPAKPSARLMSLPLFFILLILLPLMILLGIDYIIVTWLLRTRSLGFLWVSGLILVPTLFMILWISRQIMRYTEAHFAQFGNSLVKCILFACLPLFILVAMVNGVDSIQTVTALTKKTDRNDTPKALDYRFSFDDAAKTYHIEGVIDFGITRDFRQFIVHHPEGRIVVLESTGGSIYEGRGLAALFSGHSLETRVIGECSSACTLAYIGGVRRTLGGNGQLGFHQYGLSYLNAHQKTPFFDPQKEQQKDQKNMLKQGIDATFISSLFNKPSHDIWFPSSEHLVRAGVVHANHKP